MLIILPLCHSVETLQKQWCHLAVSALQIGIVEKLNLWPWFFRQNSMQSRFQLKYAGLTSFTSQTTSAPHVSAVG